MSKNIFDLVRENDMKKLVVSAWSEGSKCYVVSVKFNKENRYGVAYGKIFYKDGNIVTGKIANAGCYKWRLLKVLNEPIGVSDEI